MTARLAAALLLLGSAPAQEPHHDRCELIDGTAIDGRVTEISAGGVVTVLPTGLDSRSMSLDQIYRIKLSSADVTVPAGAGGTSLWLRSGQEFAARLEGATEGKGVFAFGFSAATVELPWRFVRGLRFGDATTDLDPGFAEKLARPSARRDLLYARRDDGNLQRLSVSFRGISEGRVEVEFGGKQQLVALDRLYGIVFGEQSGARPDAQPKPLVDLLLHSGGAVSGKLLGLDAEVARLRLDEGIELAVPRPALAGVRVRSDKLVFLNELTPRIEQVPAFDRVWPVLRDQGPGGDAIRLGGVEYRSGYVVYPRTRLSYAIDGHYDTLEVMIGLEDRAGDRAHAIFRVRGDDDVLFDSGGITPESAPRAVKVSISGVKTLTLEADFGEGFDFGDLCVFAIPRVLKN